MPIVTTVTFQMFKEAFTSSFSYKDKFTTDALQALYDYYSSMDDDLSVELDVVAFACEWSEYENQNEVRDAYQHLMEPATDETDYGDYLNLMIDEVCKYTDVIELPGNGYLVRNF
jgi:hypothetical protein